MSSEGTLSVGGGEGVRDVSSSSSLSGGSGGKTSVSGGYGGQEGSLLPANILEVGDNRRKCYDESDEVVGEVVGRRGASVFGSKRPLDATIRALPGSWAPVPNSEVASSAAEGIWVGVNAGGSGKEKWWFYFTPRVARGRSRNLFTAGPSSVKGWKEKFFFVDDTEWRRGDGEVEELSSPEVVESFGIYGRSSLSQEEMNRLRVRGRLVRLPEKRPHPGGGSRAEVGPSSEPRRGATEEVVAWKRPRVEEVQPLQIEALVEFVPRPPPVQIYPALREVEAVAIGMGKSFVPYPRQVASFYDSGRTVTKHFIGSHFPEVDLQRAKDEVAANGGSGTVNLVNAMAVEFFNCLQERIALVKKNEELGRQKEETKKNFGELTWGLEKVREELANSRRVAELEEQKRKKCEEALARRDSELAEVKKAAELAVHNSVEEHVSNFVKSATFAEVVDLYRLPTLVMAFVDCHKKVKVQNPEVDVTSITFGPEEARVEENRDSKTAKFHPEVKLTWELDEARKTILPLTLDFEFVTVDEEEADVAPRTEVADNIRNIEPLAKAFSSGSHRWRQCSCKELGGTPDLKSSLRLSCKAPRLVFGVDTSMLRPSRGCPRVDPSEKSGQQVSNIAGASHEGLVCVRNYCGAGVEGTSLHATELACNRACMQPSLHATELACNRACMQPSLHATELACNRACRPSIR
ncbi:hypothetical protein SLEP1_g11946 [Rubroshorea leprosula]|nr:hypothetical protein SLEP1_g11946 [Rubroshorea leprosula]